MPGVQLTHRSMAAVAVLDKISQFGRLVRASPPGTPSPPHVLPRTAWKDATSGARAAHFGRWLRRVVALVWGKAQVELLAEARPDRHASDVPLLARYGSRGRKYRRGDARIVRDQSGHAGSAICTCVGSNPSRSRSGRVSPSVSLSPFSRMEPFSVWRRPTIFGRLARPRSPADASRIACPLLRLERVVPTLPSTRVRRPSSGSLQTSPSKVQAARRSHGMAAVTAQAAVAAATAAGSMASRCECRGRRWHGP